MVAFNTWISAGGVSDAPESPGGKSFRVRCCRATAKMLQGRVSGVVLWAGGTIQHFRTDLCPRRPVVHLHRVANLCDFSRGV